MVGCPKGLVSATQLEHFPEKVSCELAPSVRSQEGRQTVKSEDMLKVKLGSSFSVDGSPVFGIRLARDEACETSLVVDNCEQEVVALLADWERADKIEAYIEEW